MTVRFEDHRPHRESSALILVVDRGRASASAINMTRAEAEAWAVALADAIRNAPEESRR